MKSNCTFDRAGLGAPFMRYEIAIGGYRDATRAQFNNRDSVDPKGRDCARPPEKPYGGERAGAVTGCGAHRMTAPLRCMHPMDPNRVDYTAHLAWTL